MNQLTAKRLFYHAFVLLLLFYSSLLHAQKAYWQQQVDFDIAVSLNDVKHTLDGNETIVYKNNSPDTLRYIFFHLWPNAYKNDSTAFSEQMVSKLGNNSFYFSKSADKGYINRLAFKVDGQTAQLEENRKNIDIVKLILPQPLPPGKSTQIATPFHVQLPKNFSRSGHIDQSYQIAQWYPKPAVYDVQGWHPMPYLDQGESYNEFGNYTVSITLPKNYVVAATGQLTEDSEKEFLLSRNKPVETKTSTPVKKDIFKKTAGDADKLFPPSATESKTIHYTAQNVIDFAWFADKRFIVQHDTVMLPGHPPIDAYTFILPNKKTLWQNSNHLTKRAIHFYSQQMGNYPYPVVSVVCAPINTAAGGMEYPMVTLINVPGSEEKTLDITIVHEVGHNWLQAVLATNERDHPWMDEGMNTFYERKYNQAFYATPIAIRKDHLNRPLSTDAGEVLLTFATDTKSDQPIETTSESFTKNNYLAVAYTKAGLWMEKLEQQLGTARMQQLMQVYFDTWKMKHPQPQDFRQIADSIGGSETDSLFSLLNKTGPLQTVKPSATKVYFLYPTLNPQHKTITFLPAVGFNAYDGFQVGVALHNYSVPVTPFHFAVAPLYATGSKQFNFVGNASYTFFTQKKIQAVIPALTIARFSTDDGEGQQYEKIYRGFLKIAPSVKLVFRKKDLNSTITKWLQWKSFFISEGSFEYKQRQFPQDTFSFYAVKGKSVNTAIHQLSFGIENSRSLYPYRAIAQVQKAGDLIRATITGNYFFNYSKSQGVSIRFFAGKIFYTKTATDKVRYDNYRYHFTMYGPNGEEDYTYSNPFIERNQNTNLTGRQIVIRDGGFKYRSDFSSVRPGRSDNWLAALNFSFDVPHAINPLSVLPIDIPLKVFADVGTYAEAWQEDNRDNRFLYSIGLQLPILRYINVYAVVLQSSAFKEPNEVNGIKWWQKRLTFSVDIQNIRPKVNGVELW